jgi:hypothetical protein
LATGRYVSDLDKGDVLGPVEYVLSPFVVREYSHSNELHHPFFQGLRDDLVMPPTLIHLDKLRLYNHACPAGTGPDARIHYEYDCTVHEPVKVGAHVAVSGVVADRFTRRGRDTVIIDMELRAVADGRLLVSYRDTVLLAYAKKDAAVS